MAYARKGHFLISLRVLTSGDFKLTTTVQLMIRPGGYRPFRPPWKRYRAQVRDADNFITSRQISKFNIFERNFILRQKILRLNKKYYRKPACGKFW